MWGDSGVTVSGVLDFEKQREMEKNERWTIWDEKYHELGMQWGCIRSSAWVSGSLRFGGKVGFENKKRAFLEWEGGRNGK